MKKILLISAVAAMITGALLWVRSQTVTNPSWEQSAMSSSARITLCGTFSKSQLTTIRGEVDAALEESKRLVSIWDETTEISRFNRHQTSEPFPVSEKFAGLIRFALDFSEQTGGVFEPTIKPLLDLWGFGPDANTEPVEKIMEAVGWRKVRMENGALIKSHPAVQLDLTAIADGYGADRAADVIRKNGCADFLVEVGGEIVADGMNRSGRPWRVGIETPQPGSAHGSEIFQTLEFSGKAMATSGNYRNFRRRADGALYSHIIDPHTGRPAESDVASVTVIAGRCMNADALATALCVMGSERGLQWLKNHPEFQAFFIIHGADGQTFISKSTAGFPVLGK
jgi:thiamine biosynthesis lipoprotein